MVKPITWTKTARKARKNILEYWTEQNKSKIYSQKLSKQFRERTKYLSRNNYMGKPTGFKDVRVTVMGHFSMFYKITSSEIIIVGLWDNRRNPDDLRKNLEI